MLHDLYSTLCWPFENDWCNARHAFITSLRTTVLAKQNKSCKHSSRLVRHREKSDTLQESVFLVWKPRSIDRVRMIAIHVLVIPGIGL